MEEVPRTVRKIKLNREEIPPNPNDFGKMTWEEALNKNLISDGMTVKFQMTEFKDIRISHDESGVEQTISGKLIDGIVAYDEKDKSFCIITYAKFTSPFKLFGRFGRVFGVKAVKKVADKIYNQTSLKRLERKILEYEKVMRIVMYSNFLTSYLYNEVKENCLVEVDDEKEKRPRGFNFEDRTLFNPIDIERKYQYSFDGIMLMLHVNLKDIVNIEKCLQIETNKPISIKLNFFDSYITI